jgi:hypothetical protein
MFPYCTVGGSARPDRAHLERSGDRKIPTGQSDQGADSCRDADHGGTLLSNRVGAALRSTARPVSKLLCIPYELFRKLGLNTDWSPPWLVSVTLRIAMIQFSCRLSRGRKIITWLWKPWSQKQYRRTSIFAADFRPVTRAALQKRGLVY